MRSHRLAEFVKSVSGSCIDPPWSAYFTFLNFYKFLMIFSAVAQMFSDFNTVLTIKTPREFSIYGFFRTFCSITLKLFAEFFIFF